MAGKKKVIEVPPMKDRTCQKHGIPILPSRWKNGCRHHGCWRCMDEWGIKKARQKYEKSAKGAAKYKRYNDKKHRREACNFWHRSARRRVKIQEGKI